MTARGTRTTRCTEGGSRSPLYSESVFVEELYTILAFRASGASACDRSKPGDGSGHPPLRWVFYPIIGPLSPTIGQPVRYKRPSLPHHRLPSPDCEQSRANSATTSWAAYNPHAPGSFCSGFSTWMAPPSPHPTVHRGSPLNQDSSWKTTAMVGAWCARAIQPSREAFLCS
jgi:hypothetical protein